jgi:tetratricopeptide (TPR) repeat protein
VNRSGLAAAAILVAGTIAIYANSLSVPEVLDDKMWIRDNLSIRSLSPLWPFLRPASAAISGRPLLNLSYAINYAFGGRAVFGYHAVNIAIHALAGLVLFALVRLTLRLPSLAGRFGAAATPLALAVAAIWAWHPIQTESVTYLAQRAESLMGLFYLATLYCFARAALSAGAGGRRAWSICSFLACLAGVGTKEIIATAPLAVFLYDRTFLSGSFPAAWRRHRTQLLALAATWIPLGALMSGLPGRGAGFGHGATAWTYGITECRVVVKYLLLSLWPHPLALDYGPFTPPDVAALLPYALAIACLVAASLVAAARAPAAGFAACWFFLILAPASSIIPLTPQPMAESRLYLPLAGVVALAVLGAYAAAGRRALPILAALAMGLGAASISRNRDYATEEGILRDNVAKVPGNPRARNNLGNALLAMPGRLDEAIAQYREAIRLEPAGPGAHNNLGNALLKIPGRLADATAEYEEAVRLDPDFADAHGNLGNAYLRIPGRLGDATAQYLEAIRLDPDFAEAHNNLGEALRQTPGRLDEAIAQYREAIRLEPDFAEAHDNWGKALEAVPGRRGDAIAQFDEAVRINPGFAAARFDRGDALYAAGRAQEAIAAYGEALRLDPDLAEAHNNLANALCAAGRLPEGVAEYEAAIRIEPGVAAIHLNLAGALLRMPGRNRDVAAQLREVLRLDPGNGLARRILEKIERSPR